MVSRAGEEVNKELAKVPLRKRRVWKLPLPVFVLIVVAIIGSAAAIAILLGPISAPAATTVKKIEMQINSISGETIWGNQYLNNDFNVSVITNTYSSQRSGVVPIMVIQEFTCAQLTSQGFVLKIATNSTYGALTTISGVDATGISKGPSNYASGCAFIPDAGTFGKTITAGQISTVTLPWSYVWFFRFTFGSGDVSGNTYTFTAQPYAP